MSKPNLIHPQDLNDNPPLFGKQRYFTSVPEDLPPGSSVLRVSADDADSGRNARVTYSINRRQSDRDGVFRIDPSSGLLVLDKRLDYDRKQVRCSLHALCWTCCLWPGFS